MDPISLSLGVVSVSETAFSVSKFLTTTWKSYRNAPEEVLEIAHEVNVCRCLMSPFGERLKAGSMHYNPDFQSSVHYLVENSRKAFSDIQKFIPDDGRLDRGSLRKWTYVLQKSEVMRHRKRLKQIQQMFIFMKEMMTEAHPSGSARSPFGGSSGSSPIVLSGVGKDASGATVTYTATLSMQPTNPIQSMPGQNAVEPEDQRSNKQSLNALRQSLYFSSDLLQQVQEGESRDDRRRRAYARSELRERERRSSASDVDVFELPSELEASRDVDRLLTTWFGKESTVRFAAPVDTPGSDQSKSDFTPPKSPDKPPSPKRTSSVSTPQSPKSPGTDSFSGHPDPERTAARFRCDSCKDKILSTRYDCKSCDDFHLCKQCYDDPKITLKLRHRHPTTYFVEKR